MSVAEDADDSPLPAQSARAGRRDDVLVVTVAARGGSPLLSPLIERSNTDPMAGSASNK